MAANGAFFQPSVVDKPPNATVQLSFSGDPADLMDNERDTGRQERLRFRNIFLQLRSC